MSSRLSLVARHLSRPVAAQHSSRSLSPASRLVAGIMASSTAAQNFKRTINTAACLVIGDEVLGGKVSLFSCKLLFKATGKYC